MLSVRLRSETDACAHAAIKGSVIQTVASFIDIGHLCHSYGLFLALVEVLIVVLIEVLVDIEKPGNASWVQNSLSQS